MAAPDWTTSQPENTPRMWRVGVDKWWLLSRPRVLGILNVTPDSFSDGGRYPELAAAVAAVGRMLAAGADGIDIGGESTRPGAHPVRAEVQIARVVPVVSAVRREFGSGPAISIDTTLASVAGAALDAGADAINDVSGCTDDAGMLPLAARWGAGLILMHRLVAPANDSFSTRYGEQGQKQAPAYRDVVKEVREWLAARAGAAVAAGVDPLSVVLDPGLGFGKTVEQNGLLIENTRHLSDRYPIMSGLSRKSFVPVLCGLPATTPVEHRVAASVQLSLRHVRSGAAILRVHDVAEHVAALGAEQGSIPEGLRSATEDSDR